VESGRPEIDSWTVKAPVAGVGAAALLTTTVYVPLWISAGWSDQVLWWPRQAWCAVTTDGQGVVL